MGAAQMSYAVDARKRRLAVLREHLKKAVPCEFEVELMRFQLETGVTAKVAREYFELIRKVEGWTLEQDPDSLTWFIK